MMINKDQSIIDLLARLKIEERGWFIRDDWEADLCAIGISSHTQPSRLVYVSTFDKLVDDYDYEFEQLRSGSGDDYDCVSEQQDVGFEALACKMEVFLS